MITKQFYECLFDADELTVFGDNIYATKPSKAIANGVKEERPFFVINPIRPGKTRSIDGVKLFRNFMFEIDNDMDGNTVPLEKQKEIVTAAQLPWSTCIYSGGKSLHWIVSLEEPVGDAVEYRIWWLMMESILNSKAKAMGLNLKFDGNVKDPSRFSRAAGAVRIDRKQIQTLQGVRGRQANAAVIKWFTANAVTFEEFTPKPTEYEIGQINQDADDVEKFEFVKNILMKAQPYEQGNKNTWQFVFSRLCRRCGISEADVRYQVVQICGEVDHRDPVASAFSDKYNSDEPIYVLSKAERSAWAKQKHFEEESQERQSILDSGEAENYLHVNGVFDYIRVGTSFYKKEEDELVLWNKDTLTMDFGTEHIKQFPDQLKYTKFCNIMDFVNPVEHDGRRYNLFRKPTWEPEPGQWKTTERLLRKVFSAVGDDQWEQGLDWIQLQITQPKQNLHALVLGSESREAGKDTFVEWLRLLYGNQNVFFDSVDQFLDGFNGAYASKLIIALNEVKFSSITDGSLEKLKNYVTQKTITINEKFEKKTEIDYYGKIILLTNNTKDFMNIHDEENRFWIRTMPDLDKKKEYDPNFMNKLQAEVPHFLHFILNRKLDCKEKQTRFWLPEETTHTSELKLIKENSKSSLYMEIYDLIDDTFYRTHPNCQDIFFVIGDIRERVKTDVGPKQIKLCLQKEFGQESHKALRKNTFTTEERNSHYFSINRSEFYGQTESTPGLDDVFVA
jgi:hypothetical protein